MNGRIQFDVNSETVELRSGDSVIVGAMSSIATALEDSEVLDVFAPCRDDYAL
jgi:mannose-6-phosphate isomerase-like protein (cupin superfamily)